MAGINKNGVTPYGFIGSGLGYRPGSGMYVNGEGGIGIMHAEQDIAKSIYIILSTAPGERVMRPEFGCGIHNLVFMSPNSQTYGMISYYVVEALTRWEPRVEIQSVDVDTNQTDNGLLLIDIKYKISQTNKETNLVYPFYAIPREPD